MYSETIRAVDSRGRVYIPEDLMKLCNLEIAEKIAVCRSADNKILIRKLNDIENLEVNRTSKIDQQKRINIFAGEKTEKKVRVYSVNGHLIMEEAHI